MVIPLDTMRAIAVTAVKKKAGLFAAGEVGMEDLIQEGMIAAMSAHKTFQLGKGATYSSYLYRSISCDLIDFARKRSRRDDWEHQATRFVPGDVLQGLSYDKEVDDAPVDQRLRRFYLAATASPAILMTTPKRRGWVKSRAQALAIAALRHITKQSNRSIAYMFRQNQKLRDAIELNRYPDRRFIDRSSKFDPLFAEIS